MSGFPSPQKSRTAHKTGHVFKLRHWCWERRWWRNEKVMAPVVVFYISRISYYVIIIMTTIIYLGKSLVNCFPSKSIPGRSKKNRKKWKGGTKNTKNKSLRRISYKTFLYCQRWHTAVELSNQRWFDERFEPWIKSSVAAYLMQPRPTVSVLFRQNYNI